MEQNWTSGGAFKSIVRFSLPYLASYFLQTLYGMADLFIVGQFGTVADTTAVSIGSQAMHMLTVMIVGLAMGATVMISRQTGARNSAGAAKAAGNAVSIFMLLSAALTAVLLLLAGQIVRALATPGEAAAGTVRNLTVCFMGIPFITAYNVISSIFRGLGDTKSPMYFVAVACVLNIALDYLFIALLGLGPLGAALGTTLSQTVSVAVCLAVILRRKDGIRLKKSDFVLEKATAADILKVSVPVAVQDGFIQVAFIVITVSANRRGQAGAGAADASVCGGCFGGVRSGGFRHRLFCGAAGCLRVHQEQPRRAARRPVPARLHLGLHFCGRAFLLQRLLLRLPEIVPFVHAQRAVDCAGAHSVLVYRRAAVRRHAVSHGACGSARLAAVRRRMPVRVRRFEEEGRVLKNRRDTNLMRNHLHYPVID